MRGNSATLQVESFLADLRAVGVAPPAQDRVEWFVSLHAKSAPLQHVLLRLAQQGRAWGVTFRFVGDSRLHDVQCVCEKHGFTESAAAVFANNVIETAAA